MEIFSASSKLYLMLIYRLHINFTKTKMHIVSHFFNNKMFVTEHPPEVPSPLSQFGFIIRSDHRKPRLSASACTELTNLICADIVLP